MAPSYRTYTTTFGSNSNGFSPVGSADNGFTSHTIMLDKPDTTQFREGLETILERIRPEDEGITADEWEEHEFADPEHGGQELLWPDEEHDLSWHVVTREDVCKALRIMGLEPDDVRGIEMHHDHVVVEEIVREPDGKPRLCNDDLMTVFRTYLIRG